MDISLVKNKANDSITNVKVFLNTLSGVVLLFLLNSVIKMLSKKQHVYVTMSLKGSTYRFVLNQLAPWVNFFAWYLHIQFS